MSKILLQCNGVCKSFGKNRVLKDIDLTVEVGSVHALLGQNGAGKSTLASGEILFDGQPVKIDSPQSAERLGISIIHQDQQLVPLFDVTRNAFLGNELRTRSGALDFRAMRQKVAEQLQYIQADFGPDDQISALTVGQREQVAIVSALLQNPRLLILDEPTASLGSKEIDRLFEIIEILRDKGVTIIYISHHLDEIFRITDSITVLRDARRQGTLLTKQASHEQIVTMMIGRKLEDFYPKEPAEIGEVVLRVKDLRQGKLVQGVSFELKRGEILGFAGLVGAGRTESMLTLYGTQPSFSGEIELDGKRYVPQSPWSAREAGFALIPEDRRNEGIISQMSIAENLSLSNTGEWARRGIINKKLEKHKSNAIIRALNIVCTDMKQQLMDLSGGNQQKVVIGKWIDTNAKVYIFDQPTTGVDVGAKTEIYKQMIHLAQQGAGVIFISSEHEELLGICDRIVVMARGRIVADLPVDEADDQKLLYWAASGEAQQTGGESA